MTDGRSVSTESHTDAWNLTRSMMMKKLLLSLTALLISAAASHAAVIVSYDFQSDLSGSIDPSFSGIVTADNYVTNIGGRSGSGKDVYVLGDQTPQSDPITDSGNTGLYHEFTLNISGLGTGEQLNLTGWSGNYYVDSSADFRLGLYSNAGALGFSNGDILQTETLGFGGDIIFAVDLTSANSNAGTDFTGLTNGESVAFRFYFGDNSGSNTRRHRLDDITVSGQVIPEPATLTLLAGFLTLVILRRTRR